ncbi:xanthine dehydrogenase/oxidase-like [Haliotis rufescens]|uniref:xanthine dehydrogenase/oxidase-like n=1 Tax=Haliotis rufescens TaxID=6454 RepID=UPI00201ED155|nr:xanthine dehydrogenase/oxidase-like [Haliotis rufescens]XP_048259666.1 xanthine dehydrogenase/oxidase-like [Haliotis rufescens]
MSMYTLLRNSPRPTQEQIEDNFSGNLCRCTGYRPILQGMSSFAKGGCRMGDRCCRVNVSDSSPGAIKGSDDAGSSDVLNGVADGHLKYDPTQEPIFPPELKTKSHLYETSLRFSSERVTWHRPVTLDELFDLKNNFPTAKIVVGNTEVGIETKLKNMEYPILVAATHIPSLHQVETSTKGITFGSSVSLATVDDVLRKAIADMPEYKTRSFRAFVEMLQWFAGHQIRNVASIGGNITTASPISDLNPLLVAAGATLTVGSKHSAPRDIVMDGDFFKGYRRTAIQATDVLISVTIPYTLKNEYFRGFKQAHRKEDDISIVNAGMRVRFLEGTDVVEDLVLVYGGMAATTVLASNTRAGLRQQEWNDQLFEKACVLLASDLPLDPGSPGGMVEYRRALTTSFFFKFFVDVREKLHGCKENTQNDTGDVTQDVTQGLSEGVQLYQAVAPEQDPDDAVGRPLVHTSALQQTTGEAIYVDDLPKVEGELYAALVMSTRAHAKLVSVDPSEALRMRGIIDYVSLKDIPGSTTWGMIVPDEEEIFASEKVIFEGQVIACIVGESQQAARRAAKKVKVEYEELTPVITIKEAIEANSFFGPEVTLETGDLEEGFGGSDHVIGGELHIGPQEHFYLETQVAAARPTNEDGGIEVISNTQFPSGTQHKVAAALNIPANRVVSRVKRLGGGFGGKEGKTNMVALPVAVAAAKLNRPVRCMLERDEDMVLTGGRHAYLAKYKVGFTKTGLIKALEVNLFSNAGCTIDLSHQVMGRSLYSSDNAYNIPNIKVTGHVCKTNTASATAFRGFGTPQAMLVTETWMDAVADVVGRSAVEVREINLYREGEMTYYGMEVKDANVRSMWDQCISQSDYVVRRNHVDDYNSKHRWKKRGLALIPTQYGMSFSAPINHLNQACALVTAYMDGSVLLAHCGVEMGQGLHTKMKQVASRALGVPVENIYTQDVCTDKIHFTSATAASTGSDLNGGAVKNACEILSKRLQPYRDANPKGTLKDWVTAAYFDRIHLSAAGFYRGEELEVDPATGKGRYYSYFTTGVACSEVEIDCLTGDHQILRTDIVMDVGKSLNPTLDIGQIEGAFMQGYGLFCLEQHKTTPSGSILTRGPGTYKIPSFKNIPIKFNVSLLKESCNPKAIYSSKGIGEPPLFLASSVFFAVKDAIKSAREDAGESRWFRLDSPATPERIRMACQDQFTKQFAPAEEGTFKPWYVEL